MIRQIAKEKREAIANGELEPIDKPAKKEKKTRKVKEDIIFNANEEEVIISEEEPESVIPVLPPPKKFDKKPKGATIPQVEPEPKGIEPEPEVEPTKGLVKQEPMKKQKSTNPAKKAEEKPIKIEQLPY